MLEGLAAWVLNTYVGEYVENLNTDQLSIALLQGAVELENLPLKKDALKSLDIPLEVKSGLIGKITLRIPLRRLRSEPWVISIEKLYLVAGPLSNLQHDEKAEKKQHQEAKRAMLEALESKWQILRQSKAESTSWFSYGASMAANILENIQLNVKDVHLRYEDDVTNPACPFACGVTIKTLSVHSTDLTWVPKFVSTADIMYKLVDLQSLAVYCDTGVAMLAQLSLHDLADELQRDMFRSKDNMFKEHEYILKPINSQARVKRYTSAMPLRSAAKPRITVDLSLDTMAFCLSTGQYRSLLLWHKEFSRHNRRRKFQKFRPACSVRRNAVSWWKYAILAHLSQISERNRRSTWSFLTNRIHQVALYCNLYASHLTGRVMSFEEEAAKDEIEDELEYEELRIVRERVFFKLRRENKLLFEISKKSSGSEISTTSMLQPAASTAQPNCQESSSSTTAGGGGGLFKSWFPGWSGWYQSTPAQTLKPAEVLKPVNQPEDSLQSESEVKPVTTYDEEVEIEQEILDVLHESSENSSFLRKDTVFARMSFALKTGSFKLVENIVGDTETGSCPLAELQCTTINMEFESRPRTSAMKFSLAVGSLYLEDLSSKNTVFPYLICPQAKDPLNRSSFNPILQTRGQRLHSLDDTSDPKWQFFKLVYEKNPLSSLFKYKACVTTRGIDIIYTPALLRRMKEVFTVPNNAVYKGANAVSSWQFEKLKKQTQEELINTLDQLLEAEHSKGRWYIDLDISAPKLIVPENVLEENSGLVVMDLGNFRLKTVSTEEAPATMIDEDDFVTPLSTPPNEREVPEDTQAHSELTRKDSNHALSLTDAAVLDKLYEKYKIELTEMQVLMGRLRDNWRSAYARGSSQMHILDRFSISLQLERRLIVTADPQWPAATVSCTLPSLTFHLNERKIQALRMCADTLSSSSTTLPSLASSNNLSTSSLALGPMPSLADTVPSISEVESVSMNVELPDNNLFRMQFLINSMSLELQSQGKALVELQVTGVQAIAAKKPDGVSIALTVHSLLVVDALQSYGPDFELLVASHHNVQLDSRSGSIMGSEVNSPVSPQSPSSPASPRSPSPTVNQSTSFSSFQAIHDAFSSAFHSVMPKWHRVSGVAATGTDEPNATVAKSEALISLEFEIIARTAASDDKRGKTGEETPEMRILNLQFNSLDFIANQETLVEILAFLKSAFPSLDTSNRFPQRTSRISLGTIAFTPTPEKSIREQNSSLFITADFKRLNVLMLRFLAQDGGRVARKVATATMSAAKVQATLDGSWQVEGSLGGLHLLDVVPEGTLYQQVISIGQGQMATHDHQPPPLSSTSPNTSLNPEMFKTAMDDRIFPDVFPVKVVNRVACRFSISKKIGGGGASASTAFMGNASTFRSRGDCGASDAESDIFGSSPEVVEASFDMASLCYIHCPKFLEELVDCVSEFRHYVSSVATSIKTSAMEVAMGIVGGRSGGQGDKDNPDAVSTTSLHRQQSLGDITTTVLLQERDRNILFMASSPERDVPSSGPIAKGSCILLSARMETPIIVIPRKPNSSQVLLAHLGEISVDNNGRYISQHDDDMDDYQNYFPSLNLSAQEVNNHIFISLTNMNLYSVDFDKHKRLGRSLSSSSFSGLTHELGVPILYDTAVDLYISKRSLEMAECLNDRLGRNRDDLDFSFSPPFQFQNHSPAEQQPIGIEDHILPPTSVLEVSIKISSPIKLGLSKEVYEQILQTMDHLTYDADLGISGDGDSKEGVSGAESVEQIEKRGDEGVERTNVSGAGGGGEGSGDVFNRDRLTLGVDKKWDKHSESLSSPGVASKEMGDSLGSFMAKRVKFQVPLFEVELRGDFGEGEQGLVDLQLYDFAMDYEKNDRATTHLKLRLRSLQMDDLLESVASQHRQIIVSRNSKKDGRLSGKGGEQFQHHSGYFMSTSCPDCTIIPPIPRMPPSLPSSFQDSHSPMKASYKMKDNVNRVTVPLKQPLKRRGAFPGTPPPTPQLLEMIGQQDETADDLVHIDVVLVDRKLPEYTTKYNRTNRFIDVEFSSLETTINLQTWVVLLDFLGMGAKVHDNPAQDQEGDKVKASAAPVTPANMKEVVNSEIKFRVESFALILNKPEYELARATAGNLSMQVSLRDENISVTGQLGSLSLLDQSPNGTKYTQRFVSVGKQVMQFKIFKYGLPDFAMKREFDISLKLSMSSVRYVHTNRFQSELVAFCQHFLQLQDVLGRMRAASAGQRITDEATRGARIKLDIEADSPIVLLPESSRTDHVLVADLGQLRLTNRFIIDGKSGTLGFKDAQSKIRKDSEDVATAASSKKAGSVVRNMTDMTESVFEHSYPPMSRDPMMASIYGSLDEDVRCYDVLEVVSRIMPSESVLNFSPDRGSSVDPQASTSGRFVPASTSDLVPPSPSSHSTASGETVPSNSEEKGGDMGGDKVTDHCCLLDVMDICLSDIDLFTAQRVTKSDYRGLDHASDMEFTSYVVQIDQGHLLREKIQLNLHVERNLEGDVSHRAPDWRAAGQLSSVYCHLDMNQYKLVRGLLAHNLGEKVEEFQRPLMSHLQDPRIQTVLSGDVWKSVSLALQLHNVTVELLNSHALAQQAQQSLARLDFIRSHLSLESYSDQTKDIDLVSHEIVVSDTRFKEEPVNARPNVFTSILQPQSSSGSGAGSVPSRKGLQMEMHFRSAQDCTVFTVLLNNMRVMCIFDWLLTVQQFLMTEPPNPFMEGDVPATERLPRPVFAPPVKGTSSHTQSPLTISRGIITKRGPLAEEVKVPLELRLNVSDTQFVVVENSTSLDTNAVILKSTAVLRYKPQASDKVLRCSLGSLEVFSCCLMAEEDTALSIIDPMTISIELNANPLPEFKPSSTSTTLGLLSVPETQLKQLLLEVSFNTMNIRVSYHDMMMFLAILNSLPGQAQLAKQLSTSSPATPSTSNATGNASALSIPLPTVALDTVDTDFDAESSVDAVVVKGPETTIQLLQEMGFSTADCRRALCESEDDASLAALWLTKHATPVVTLPSSTATMGKGGDHSSGHGRKKGEGSFAITAMEMKASSVCLCLINDCGDADVPLAEISCNAISIHQTLEPGIEGKASFQLIGEYYNRNLSGWEPFLEPWRCNVEWKQYLTQDARMNVQILAADVLNLNLTRTFLELYDQTKGSWTEDYLTYRPQKAKERRRHPTTAFTFHSIHHT